MMAAAGWCAGQSGDSSAATEPAGEAKASPVGEVKAAGGKAGTAAPLSNTREAHCTIRVRFGWSKVAPHHLEGILRDAMDQACEAIIGDTSSPRVGHWGEIRLAGNVFFYSVGVSLREQQRPAAKECLEDAIRRVRDELTLRYDLELKAEQDRLEQIRRDLEDLHLRLRCLTSDQEGHVRTVGRPLSAEVLDGLQKDLENRMQQLQMDLAGKKARVEAIQKKIAESAARVDAAMKDDPVAGELAKVVELRQKAVQKTVLDARRAPQSAEAEHAAAMERAEVVLAEAKARLIERREAVARAAGGELLLRLNDELAVLGIDVAEIQARLAEGEQQRAMLLDLAGKIPQYERLEAEIRHYRERLAPLQEELDGMSRSLAARAPPEVTIEGKIEAK